MNMRPLLIANTALIAGMAGLSAWVWPSIPDGAQLPVHWNIEGVADRFGSKYEALLIMPVIAAAVTALLWVLPRLDPRRANIEASAKFWNAIAIAVVALLAYVHGLLVLTAMGRNVAVADYAFLGVGGLMIVIGNYLSKTRSNWFGGVRTPWTLSSEYSWEKTHRWAGRLFVVSGAATIVAWLAGGSPTATVVLIGTLIATSVVSVVLSYVFWKNDPARTPDPRADNGV